MSVYHENARAPRRKNCDTHIIYYIVIIHVTYYTEMERDLLWLGPDFNLLAEDGHDLQLDQVSARG